jgi:hypothetical protein
MVAAITGLAALQRQCDRVFFWLTAWDVSEPLVVGGRSDVTAVTPA